MDASVTFTEIKYSVDRILENLNEIIESVPSVFSRTRHRRLSLREILREEKKLSRKAIPETLQMVGEMDNEMLPQLEKILEGFSANLERNEILREKMKKIFGGNIFLLNLVDDIERESLLSMRQIILFMDPSRESSLPVPLSVL